MTSRRRRSRAGCARRHGAVLLWVALASLAPCARPVRADEPVPPADVGAAGVEPAGIELADRTVLGLGAAALFDPASPSFAAHASRFLGPHVALGLRQEGGFTTGHAAGWHLATSAFVDLHPLPDPKPVLSPFVGLAAGGLYDDDRAAGTVGPEVGVTLLATDAVVLEARYQFRWATGRVAGLAREQHLAWLSVGFLLPPGGGDDLARAQASAARAEEAAAKAEEAVARLERAVERLERAVDDYAAWFEEQLRK